jgi:translocation protein SEC63
VRNPPRLDTLENTMKLSPMIVQALWNSKSPLLQLPHITESHLRFFETKKVCEDVFFGVIQNPCFHISAYH